MIFDIFWDPFWFHSGSFFLPTRLPKTIQFGLFFLPTPRNRPKSNKNRCQEAPHLGLQILFDFWWIFHRFLHPWNPQNHKKALVFIKFFDFRHLQDEIYFGCHFGTNLAPYSLPKSTKIAPKIDPKRHQNFDRFLHRFFIDVGSFWEASLAPCWPLFRQKYGDAN